MRLSRQFQFFLRKIFATQKRKINNFPLLEVFVLQRFLLRKRIEIVLINSFTMLLMSTPLNHSMGNLFTCIYFYLNFFY